MDNYVNRFTIGISIRVLLLVATTTAAICMLLYTKLYVTIIVVALLLLYQGWALLHAVIRTNRELVRFLNAIKHADFSQSFSMEHEGAAFRDLHRIFQDIIAEFQRYRCQTEEQYQYLQTILQHIAVGIITFHENGHVHLINNAAKRLLQLTHLDNIGELDALSDQLRESITLAKPGEHSLVKIYTGEGQKQLSLYSTEFKLRDQRYRLVSLQDIRGELEDKEMESWQTLIRVLTHEIMNSMTPISSLSSTAFDLIDSFEQADSGKNGEDDIREILGDLRSALTTIHNRSLGLMEFVNAYRNLTLIPLPQLEIVSIREMVSRVSRLLSAPLERNNIDFLHFIAPETLEVTADKGLIEQVLINLILNAIDAVNGRDNARIELHSSMNNLGKVVIQIRDNGPGIVEEALDKIFIPFYTTKKAGTGIGLSFSRQVMRLHNGSISVQSVPDDKTTFTLTF